MTRPDQSILGGKFKYHLSKVMPLNFDVRLSLTNGLKFVLRARTMDRSVLKDIWVKSIYDQHGVRVERGDTVVDIGAHVGIFSVYAAHRSETGKVYAFEPFIENYTRLVAHRDLNHRSNLFPFHRGVSAVPGKKTFFLSPDRNTGGHSLFLKPESKRKVEIETVTLAEFCAEHKLGRIDFLKLDCEGAEFEILAASADVLKRVRKIALECHPFGLHTAQQMADLLEGHGFTVIREKSLGSEIEMIYGRRA